MYKHNKKIQREDLITGRPEGFLRFVSAVFPLEIYYLHAG